MSENSTVPEKKTMGTLLYEVDADTERLQRKLRAMAKHYIALADELEAIDRGYDDDEFDDVSPGLTL